MSIWRWDSLLNAPPVGNRITLGEGETPVVNLRHIGPAAGTKGLWLKLEMSNPTGSYKDRFASSAISHMRAVGKRRCLATSSGNTGSALAAYCAAADVACHIAIVATAPDGKLLQMLAYGAKLFRVRDFGIDPAITEKTFAILAECARDPDAALQISAYCFSPAGMEGVQTISYELAEQLSTIDHVFVPAGGGGLTLAVARGFEALVRTGRLARQPRIHCVQPVGNDTIATPLRDGMAAARTVDCTTRISGLQVPSVLDGNHVISACRASGGTGIPVEDQEIYRAQHRLAQEEGIFSEPAGATALAGALQALARGIVRTDEVAVCLVTGSGFKDIASIQTIASVHDCPTIDYSNIAQSLSSG